MSVERFIEKGEAKLNREAEQKRYRRQAYELAGKIIDGSDQGILTKERFHPGDPAMMMGSHDRDIGVINFYRCSTTPFVEVVNERTLAAKTLAIRSRVGNDNEGLRDFELLTELSDGSQVIYARISDSPKASIAYADPEIHKDGYSALADQEVVECFESIARGLDEKFGSTLMASPVTI